ncbi:MAG TPA: choice-of-anchor tandem repeat GloVer-containing protein [Bryobacteraceae bacterium]|nr:choice-of-anchor tandem repeat GloVer-containing protein [Bryobacteraceae bacterium]
MPRAAVTRWLACATAVVALMSARASASEVVLDNFGCPPKGAFPQAGVIRDAAGNLYGTTVSGGAANQGVVYKLDPAGHQTVLYSFAGGTDGGSPYAGVIRDSVGNLYGTTYQGGTAGWGVVFKVDTTGHETVLHSFAGADGAYPYAGVIRDSAGNLYGTTYNGGTAGYGVVYKLDPAGQETVLYSFRGASHGSNPMSGVIRDAAGNLYGTASSGGTFYGYGVVYMLNTRNQETVLYYFQGGADGSTPYAGVVRDSAGNLYGTTFLGGAAGGGVVYQLDTTGALTVLHSFTGGTDGYHPVAGVVRDPAGNLYGTTQAGGPWNQGIIYEIGQGSIRYPFTGGADGGGPLSGVVLDSAGNLYGTTYGGGAAKLGVVFKLDTTSQETVQYPFPGADRGGEPKAGVIRDSAGNIYGTTYSGGAANAGVVYKVDTAGQETVLYAFTGGADGSNPYAGVIRDSAGNLYGTTYYGGAAGAGVVYMLDPTGHETVLYSFSGGEDGRNPQGGVIRDSAGNLYGTARYGGLWGAGAVYELDNTGQETVLYSFGTSSGDGMYPLAGVIRDPAGNLYGTTGWGGSTLLGAGVVYKLDPTGHETVLYSFAGGANGGYPYSGVIRDSAGNLYGTTNSGGSGNEGVVYKLDPAGNESVLYSFPGGANGASPLDGVIRDSAGNLYGTTNRGGDAGNEGIVYKLDPAGNETVIYTFTGGPDGGNPSAGVIRDSAGNLFGTTTSGGRRFGGVVFKIKP